MADKIKKAYRQSNRIYDGVLTQSNWWSKLYIQMFWGGVDDCAIAEGVLSYLPDSFSGKLLDVPVGTAVFTADKYERLTSAEITCLDYSEDMINHANERFHALNINRIKTVQGDVGNLPFVDEMFDVVLSMNGFHAFPDKERAFHEIHRVLKKDGKLMACFYIKGKSRVTDFLVRFVLAPKGWFNAPFDTEKSLVERLKRQYEIEDLHIEGSMVYFCVKKR